MATVLEEFVGSALSAYGDSSPQVAVQVWAEAARDPQVAAMASERIRDLRHVLARLVRRWQDDNTLGPDGDPDQMAQVLVRLLPGYILQRLLDAHVSPESYLEGAMALFGSTPRSGKPTRKKR